MGFAKQSHLLWPLWLAPNLTAGRHRSASPPPVLHNKRVMPLWFQRVYWKSSLSLKRERGKGKEYTPLQYWTFGIKLCRQWKLHDYRLVIAQEQSSKTEPNKESLVHLLDSLALIAFPLCLIFLQLLQVMPYSFIHVCINGLVLFALSLHLKRLCEERSHHNGKIFSWEAPGEPAELCSTHGPQDPTSAICKLGSCQACSPWPAVLSFLCTEVTTALPAVWGCFPAADSYGMITHTPVTAVVQAGWEAYKK